MNWGTWDAHLHYKYGQQGSPTDTFARGWWISADEITSDADLSQLATLGATATYDGTAWGTVDNASVQKPYDASGKLTMNWDFSKRSGELTISAFDVSHFKDTGGLSFSGAMSAPGVLSGAATSDHFGGTLSGNLPNNLGSLTGSAAGSFVNNGTVAAGGVLGNWNVNSAVYRATGIFGGVGTPVVPTQ